MSRTKNWVRGHSSCSPPVITVYSQLSRGIVVVLGVVEALFTFGPINLGSAAVGGERVQAAASQAAAPRSEHSSRGIGWTDRSEQWEREWKGILRLLCYL